MESSAHEQHLAEIKETRRLWCRKPLLREVYQGFYECLAQYVRRDVPGRIVELGAGIANLKTVLPDSVSTDLFPSPWAERVEDAYRLSYAEGTVSNLILFDVWHHLEYPGTALDNFRRVLVAGGRVIIFDPAVSLLGLFVYGLFHHEPLNLTRPIRWWAPEDFEPEQARYYSSQSNAWRVFCRGEHEQRLHAWQRVLVRPLSAISYVASGGYRGPQLYGMRLLPHMRKLDRWCDRFPRLFATRLLVVLEKK